MAEEKTPMEMMKGNYKVAPDRVPKAEVAAEKPKEELTLEMFEQKALERLGGSIAFVLKKKPVWTGEENGK